MSQVRHICIVEDTRPLCHLFSERIEELGLYKICVYFEAVVHKSTILSLYPLTCIAQPGAILLHDYWTVYNSPFELPFVCYTSYKIGDNNIL